MHATWMDFLYWEVDLDEWFLVNWIKEKIQENKSIREKIKFQNAIDKFKNDQLTVLQLIIGLAKISFKSTLGLLSKFFDRS